MSIIRDGSLSCLVRLRSLTEQTENTFQDNIQVGVCLATRGTKEVGGGSKDEIDR